MQCGMRGKRWFGPNGAAVRSASTRCEQTQPADGRPKYNSIEVARDCATGIGCCVGRAQQQWLPLWYWSRSPGRSSVFDGCAAAACRRQHDEGTAGAEGSAAGAAAQRGHSLGPREQARPLAGSGSSTAAAVSSTPAVRAFDRAKGAVMPLLSPKRPRGQARRGEVRLDACTLIRPRGRDGSFRDRFECTAEDSPETLPP